MPFRLLPKSTILDDLERWYHTLLRKWRVFRTSSRKFERRHTHNISKANV